MTRMGKPHTGRAGRTALLLALAVSLATLGFAAPALALKPTGEFVNFGDCPLKNPAVNHCIFAQTLSGHFSIKTTEVPITKTITLQGGLIVNEETGSETFVNAEDGNTLSKTPQSVPGGLFKIVAPEFFPEPLRKIFNEFISKGITGVNATTELVGPVSLNRFAILGEAPNALTLPVRVHLENSFLGNNCFVGSKTHPINLGLTTGTTSPPLPNTPIKGKVGEVEFLGTEGHLVIKNNSLVNNTFAAPEAEGCGSQILFGLFTGIIDGAVGLELGLPSASGNNTAILNGTLEDALAAAVVKSEK
jgi:hypothetical protein